MKTNPVQRQLPLGLALLATAALLSPAASAGKPVEVNPTGGAWADTLAVGLTNAYAGDCQRGGVAVGIAGDACAGSIAIGGRTTCAGLVAISLQSYALHCYSDQRNLVGVSLLGPSACGTIAIAPSPFGGRAGGCGTSTVAIGYAKSCGNTVSLTLAAWGDGGGCPRARVIVPLLP